VSNSNFEGIYILTNPAFPQFVKIGRAENIDLRVRGLNSSSAVPYSFIIYATYKTTNSERIEKFIHKTDRFKSELRAREISASGRERVREFFRIDPEQAYEHLLDIAESNNEIYSVKLVPKTKDQMAEENIADKIEKKAEQDRKQIFTFKNKGILPGAVIEYMKDLSLKAKVIDDRSVEFGGEIYTVTKLAKKFMGKVGQIGGVQGPAYFSYNGTRLFDLPDID